MSIDSSKSTSESVLESISYASGTDIGMRREENQDSFGIIEHNGFRVFVVADGMGGVQGGAIASKLAIETFEKRISEIEGLEEENICAAIQDANAQVYEKGNSEPNLAGMGTTFVGIAFEDTSAFVLNVGDSRAYRVRGNRIAQLTHDHTLVMDLIRSGAITPEQAENHPVSHMLTRSLGPTPSIESDCRMLDDGPARGDIYLLCSDGLYNMVREHEILRIVKNNSLEEAKAECIRLANERGGTDNITVILLQIGEDFPLGLEDYPDIEVDEAEDTVELFVDSGHVHYKGSNGNGSQSVSIEEDEEEEDEGPAVVLEESVAIEDVQAVYSSEDEEELAAQVDIEEAPEEEQETELDLVDESSAPPQVETTSSRLVVCGTLSLVVLLLFVGAIVIWGNLLPKNFLALKDQEVKVVQNSNEVAAPVAPQAQVAAVDLNNSKDRNTSAPRLLSPNALTADEILIEGEGEDTIEEVLEVSFNGLSRKEIYDITKRKQVLRTRIISIDEKLVSFGNPLSDNISELMQEQTGKDEKLRIKLEEVRAEIDIATRKLTVWHGRQKRLQTSNAVDLASEVAISSKGVRDSQDVFERSTWEYLKEAEVLRYDPSNNEQRAKVTKLKQQRRQRMKELSQLVKEEIEKEIEVSNGRITNLTLQRDQIEESLNELRSELEYYKVLMGTNEEAKQAKVEELKRELEVSKGELEELEELLPKEKEAKI